MKKVTINPKKLIKDDTWLEFRKVRAVIEVPNEKIVVSKEDNAIIFPGGKCEKDEKEEAAIVREIKEETGIDITLDDLEKVLQIEAFYDDFWDYRSKSFKPRHMVTTYFNVKTDKDIDPNNLNLTAGEIEKDFHIFTYSKNNLYKLLQEEHSNTINGKFFDEENRIVMEEILVKKNR